MTLKFMYIKYEPILVVSPKVYQVELWCNQNNLWKITISSRRLNLITRDQKLTQQLFSVLIECRLSAYTCLCATECLTIFWSIHFSNNLILTNSMTDRGLRRTPEIVVQKAFDIQ